jgi:hypothetical protein
MENRERYTEKTVSYPKHQDTIGNIVRDTQVQEELKRLLMRAESMQKSLSNLEDRLQSVLTVSSPRAETADKSVSEVLVPLAQQIRNARLCFDAIMSHVESIADRLEV